MNRVLNKKLGFYMPSFFRLHIATTNPIESIQNFSDYDFSIFLHEYIHFIQDITTFYGLNNTHTTVEYLRYANNHVVQTLKSDFKVPIEPDPYNKDNVFLNSFLIKLTFGDILNTNIKEIKGIQARDFPHHYSFKQDIKCRNI